MDQCGSIVLHKPHQGWVRVHDGEYEYEYFIACKIDGEYEYEYEYQGNFDGEYEYEYDYILVLVFILVLGPNLAI